MTLFASEKGSRTHTRDSDPGAELPTKRTTGTHKDGALMEPSRRNQWQSAANRRAAKAAETSHIRCLRCGPLPETSHVRRGSTVRVRQRACKSPANQGFFSRSNLHELRHAVGMEPFMELQIRTSSRPSAVGNADGGSVCSNSVPAEPANQPDLVRGSEASRVSFLMCRFVSASCSSKDNVAGRSA